MANLYPPGTRVWLEDKEGWSSAEVSSCTKSTTTNTLTLALTDENGKESTVTAAAGALPLLRNPALLESADDLATLSYLNEPSSTANTRCPVLHAVQTRYAQRKIYTYSGIVLLAVNPFEPVPLYTPEIVQRYIGHTKGVLEPHLFAIADDAFGAMALDGKGQTIIVSGESGAGKTESAKLVMRFIAAPKSPGVNSDTNSFVEGASQVEQQIQATNPILEAFGNAKTTRNDNSSRFGKYIQLLFDAQHQIVGARVRTYLLERSRLSFQAQTERNYHVFYQMCAGLGAHRLAELGLDTDYTKFHYLNQGGPSATVVGDVEKFRAMQAALGVVGIDAPKQRAIFELLAALLHLGNISVEQTRTEATIDDADPAMLRAMDFLGVSAAEFKKWTVKKQIITRSDKIVTTLTAPQAVGVRDSITRFVYACLFEWLVTAINESLTGKYGDAASRAESYVGVLDIYGFEHFDKNSFEQFCINYANEKLQHEFNTYVFKLAQEDYVKEKIEWTFIDFSDNQPAIDLMEGKLGILSLLDEESRLPLGSDASFLQKLNTQLDKPAHRAVYKMPKFANAGFTIAHYALDVTYQVDGFLEKNRDTVPDEHLALLSASTNPFLREVLDTALHRNAEPADAPAPGGAVSKIPDPGRAALVGTAGRGTSVKKPTLGSIFKGSLGTLMEMLRMTNVHYIRCLKPNQHKAAWEFDPPHVLAQLRAAGVLETIRISTAGYPSRWTFDDFSRRYYILIPSREGLPWLKKEQFKRLCLILLSKTGIKSTQYETGETKIFLRTGVLATLEAMRARRLNAVQFLQTNMRRLIAMKKVQHFRRTVIAMQAHARGAKARRAFQEVRLKASQRQLRDAEAARAAAKAVQDAKIAAAREKDDKKRKKKGSKDDKSKSSPGKEENGGHHKFPASGEKPAWRPPSKNTGLRRIYSFGSSKKKASTTTLTVPEPPPEPDAPLGRRLQAATKRLSRSWYGDSPAKELLVVPPSLPDPSASTQTPIYEQFMKKRTFQNP
ncbi:P-loop containing nucleoside triphosphate hydrolase protein [Mycena rebaudengoi]|nr:P-loop containing nucleoside triphosphate hydrolase protein [Mycena rebaudengoi]